MTLRLDTLLCGERSGLLGNSKQKLRECKTVIYRLFEAFKMHDDAIATALTLLNVYTSRILPEEYDGTMVCLACLSLADKYVHMCGGETSDYTFVLGEGAITTDRLITAERDVLNVIGHNLNIPTYSDFISYIYDSIDSSGLPSMHTVDAVCRICTFVGTEYLPSTLVASVVYILTPDACHAMADHVDTRCVESIKKTAKEELSRDTNDYTHFPTINSNVLGNISLFEVSVQQTSPENTKAYWYVEKASSKVPLIPEPPEAGRYKLGSGACGKVYNAEHRGHSYAYKKLMVNEDGSVGQWTLREQSIILSLDHPNIAKIHYITRDLDGFLMDIGRTDLDRHLKFEGSLAFEEQEKLVREMVSAVAHIHRMNCAHRDIKPDNIVIRNDGSYMLIDFSAGRAGIPIRDKLYTDLVTTMSYAAPEVGIGRYNYNQKIDVWSLACVLYEAATGGKLFQADSELQLLYRMCMLLGTPTAVTWPEAPDVLSPLWEEMHVKYPPKDDYPLSEKMCPIYKTILPMCLVMNPASRASIETVYSSLP